MSKTQSQRLAYGEELVALGYENKDIVVLEADLEIHHVQPVPAGVSGTVF